MKLATKLTCLGCGQINRVPVAKLDAGPKCAKCGVPLRAIAFGFMLLPAH